MNIATIQEVKGVVTCAGDGTAEHVFNVKNVTERALRIGIHLSVPEETPEQWLVIDGPTEVDLDVEGMTQVRVKIQAPPDCTPGNYSYRLWVFDPNSPGEHYTAGEPVYFEVPVKKEKKVVEPEKKEKRFPWWIAAVVAGVVILGGLLWYLLPTDSLALPDFTEGDWTQTKAVAFLERNGLEPEIMLQEVPDPEAAREILGQMPEPNTKVEEGATVTLKVAGVKVPKLVQSSLSEALLKIHSKGLELGDDLTIKSVKKQDQHDKVIDQEPGGGTIVAQNTSVRLVVGKYEENDVDKRRRQELERLRKKLLEMGNQRKRRNPSFAGNWRNADPNTRGITRLAINQKGSQLYVHAWGACSPRDCDWGTEKGLVNGNTAELIWNPGFATRKMMLTLKGNNQLQVVTASTYKDSRPRRKSTENFIK